MRICRLRTGYDVAGAFPCATESPRPFWADGLSLSRAWFAENLGKHVEGFHAEEDGEVIGHIYWAPSERALVPYKTEPGAAWLCCEWVRRPHQGRGHMRRLFGAFVAHLRSEGYKGVLVGATDFEGYMHHRHFARRGFRILREDDGGKLMYLPLCQQRVQVEPLTPRVSYEGTAPVEVLIVGSRFCPVGASAVLAVRRVAAEFGERVSVKEVPASLEALDRYGVADGIFINGRLKFFGPVKEDQVRAAIEAELRAA